MSSQAGRSACRAVSSASAGITPSSFCRAKVRSRCTSHPSSNAPWYRSAHSLGTWWGAWVAPGAKSNRSGAVVEETPREPVRWANPITRRTHDAPRIDLDTDVQPVRAEFRSYHSIDSRTGVPIGAGVVRLCRTPAIAATACRTHVENKTVRVDLPADVGPY